MCADQSPSQPAEPTRVILGVRFFVGTLAAATEHALAGGLVVAPSAPGMADDLVRSATYRAALTTADLAITDSGLMVLLWRRLTGEALPRNSGLALMRALLERPEFRRPGAVFWVMPSPVEASRNLAWLRGRGFPVEEADCYLAPQYALEGPLMDEVLAARLAERRPAIVILAVGGGVQERLGYGLRAALPYRPSILCLGAAIAFLTGSQVSIPVWADRFYLGWAIRLGSNPRRFWRRFWVARRLVTLMKRMHAAGRVHEVPIGFPD